MFNRMEIKSAHLCSLKKNILYWIDQKDTDYILFDSNQYANDKYAKYEWILCWGFEDHISYVDPYLEQLMELDQFITDRKDKWLVGWVNYDVKNSLYQIQSKNSSILNTADIFFSQPQHIIYITKDGHLCIQSEDINLDDWIDKWSKDETNSAKKRPKVDFEPCTSTQSYKTNIESIKNDIANGLYYELNYCQFFKSQTPYFHLADTFELLKEQTLAPFSVCIKMAEYDVLCYSPERFFCIREDRLISQPIKGTIAVGDTTEKSSQNEMTLYQSEKNRAENVMIVDLVRNDMTKCCQLGTIEVTELFGVYPFKNVIHMISTVEGRLREEVSFFKIIKALFPMGSMTGAPKLICMESIDKYEEYKRGLFSGTVGYIDPQGDMDFNVVIRTLFYDKKQRQLTTVVGGAIVYDSVAEDELNECYTKIKPILDIVKS